MRTMNVRLLICLLGAVLVGGTGVYFLHAYQVERQAGIFLREARRARENDNPSDADKHFRRYLSFSPHDTSVLIEYGTFLEEANEIDQAYFVLGSVLRLDPDNDEIRRRVVTLALTIARYWSDGAGRLTDAKQHLEEYLLDESPQGFCEEDGAARRFDSDDGELLELWGKCLAARRRNPRAAAQILEKAIITPPVELATFQFLADLVNDQLHQPERARQVLDALVERHGEDGQSYLIRGRWLRDHFQTVRLGPESDRQAVVQAIWDDVERAWQLAPAHAEVAVLGAEVALLRNDSACVRDMIDQSLEVSPANAQLYAAAAQIELYDGNLPAAIAQLERGLQQIPGEQALLWNLAVLELDAGDLKKAGNIERRLRTAGFPHERLAYLTGRVLMSEQQWRDAVREFEGVLGELARFPELIKEVNYALGVCYQQLRNYEKAQTAFARAVANDPRWVKAQMGLAAALVESGNTERAAEIYRQLVRLPGAPRSAWLALASLMFRSQLALPPPKRDWLAVVQVVKQADQGAVTIPDVPILLANVALVQGNRDEARAVLAAAAKENPDVPRLRAAEIDFAIRHNDWTHAKELFRQLGDTLENALELRLVKARYFARRFGPQAAEELDALQAAAGDLAETERILLIEKIADLYTELGLYEQAAAATQILAGARPHDLKPRLLLFDLALRSKNVESMQEVLGEVERIEGRGPLWQYGQAIRLTVLAHESGDPGLYQTAQDHLTEAALARPSWARIPALLGEIYVRRGHLDLAVDKYMEAIELGEQGPTIYSQVFSLLFQQGRYVEADHILRRMQDVQAPVAPELYRAAAAVSLELDNFDRALVLARHAAARSDDPHNRIWLGQVLQAMGQHTQAEAEFRKAIEMDSSQAGGWVSLVRHYAQHDQLAAAQSTIDDAQRALDPAHSALTVAQCYEIIGELESAEREYRSALKASPQDAAPMLRIADFYLRIRRGTEAEQWLAKLTSGAVPLAPHELRWARRALSGLRGLRGGHESFLEALALIDQNLVSTEQSAADRLTKANILASQPRRSARREAIRILEELADEPNDPFSSDDRFRLASLYLAEGDWSRWNHEMLQLLGSKSDRNRQYIAAYAGALLAQGEISEAELYIDRLQELAPESQTTVELQLKLWFARKRYENILQLLTSRIDETGLPEGAGGDEGTLARQSHWAARQLELYGALLEADNQPESEAFLTHAERAYRISQNNEEPGGDVAVATFHARHGHVDRALLFLQTNKSHLTAAQVAEIARAILRHGTQAELEQLQASLAHALRTDSTSIPLRVALADLFNRLDPAQAASLYREILADDPRNVVVLNNLAILLALDSGKTQEAAQLIQRAIDVAGPIGVLLDTRGIIALAASRPQQALVDFDQALDEGETAPRRFHQAQALVELDRLDEAEEAFRRAQELGLTVDRLFPVEREQFQRLARRLAAAEI